MDPELPVQILRDFDSFRLGEIAAIVALFWFLSWLAAESLPRLAVRLPARGRLFVLSLPPVLRLLLISVALALVVPRVIDPTPQNVLALMGTAGLAIGFAFKDYVSSLIAGVVTLYERPYRPGDWVEIEGVYGEVQMVGLRAMRLVTPDDTAVTIPHLKIWGSQIHNATDGKNSLLCVASFYLPPQHEAAAVRDCLREVALTSAYLQAERPISVIAAERPWGTHYRLKAYPANPVDQFLFTTDLTIRGKAALTRLGMDLGQRLPLETSDETKSVS